MIYNELERGNNVSRINKLNISRAKLNSDRLISAKYNRKGERVSGRRGGDKSDRFNYLLDEFKFKLINNVKYLNI